MTLRSQSNDRFYFVKAKVNEEFINDYQTECCQSLEFKRFFNDTNFTVYLSSLNINWAGDHVSIPTISGIKERERRIKQNVYVETLNNSFEKTIQDVHIMAEITYLFYWGKKHILSIILDSAAIPNNLEDFVILPIDSSLNHYQEYFSYRETFPKCYLNGERSRTVLELFDLIPHDQAYPEGISHKSLFPGIFMLLPKNKENVSPKFLLVDKKGHNVFLNPVKYMIFMSSHNVFNFKKKLYDKGSESYMSENSDLQKYIYDNYYYYLLAEGYGSSDLIESEKWKLLVDYNVFGNFKCMLPNTFIPSPELFNVPKIPGISQEVLDQAFPMLDPGDSIGSIDRLDSQFGPVYFQLLKKASCSGIYAIHAKSKEPYNGGRNNKLLGENTVNNLNYLPGVYFLPDYFKVQSINWLSPEDFIKEQCKIK